LVVEDEPMPEGACATETLQGSPNTETNVIKLWRYDPPDRDDAGVFCFPIVSVC